MDELKQRIDQARRALASLKTAIETPYSEIVRDSCIKRFKFSIELVRKCVKHYLHDRENVVCASPNAAFREAVRNRLIDGDEGELFIEMVKKRNLTAHAYIESVAQDIYEALPGYFIKMDDLIRRLAASLSE